MTKACRSVRETERERERGRDREGDASRTDHTDHHLPLIDAIGACESVQSATAVLAVRVDDIHHKPTADKAIAYIKQVHTHTHTHAFTQCCIYHLCVCVDQLPGVLGCVRARRTSHVRITYNPHLIGARQLLQRIADEGGIDAQWAPADDLQASNQREREGGLCVLWCLRRVCVLRVCLMLVRRMPSRVR